MTDDILRRINTGGMISGTFVDRGKPETVGKGKGKPDRFAKDCIDSPEDIARCLSCPKPRCTDCIRTYGYKPKKRPAKGKTTEV